MIQQLRIYEIFERNKAAFHARFRDRRIEFVYLLTWPDVATKGAAWNEFRADQEWKDINRVTAAEHSDLVGEIQDRVLVPASYTPKVSVG